MSTKRSIRLWGCGGCGINLVKPFYHTADTPHSANLVLTLVDTSESNTRGLDNEALGEIVYRIPDVDGSGKVRAENAAVISQHIEQILLTQKPLDFNIVVFSASGGSGSVFGPLLMQAIAQQGYPVIGVVVGTTESLITTRNSLNTLKSLYVISQRLNQPLSIWYGDNQLGRTANDDNARAVISILSILSSGTIQEIDSEDIRNWIRVDKTAGALPGLYRLSIFVDVNDPEWANVEAVSVASISTDPQSPLLTVTPDYHTQGYADLKTEGLKDVHLAIDPNGMTAVVKSLEGQCKVLESAKSLRKPSHSLVSSEDVANDDGLIL